MEITVKENSAAIGISCSATDVPEGWNDYWEKYGNQLVWESWSTKFSDTSYNVQVSSGDVQQQFIAEKGVSKNKMSGIKDSESSESDVYAGNVAAEDFQASGKEGDGIGNRDLVETNLCLDTQSDNVCLGKSIVNSTLGIQNQVEKAHLDNEKIVADHSIPQVDGKLKEHIADNWENNPEWVEYWNYHYWETYYNILKEYSCNMKEKSTEGLIVSSSEDKNKDDLQGCKDDKAVFETDKRSFDCKKTDIDISTKVIQDDASVEVAQHIDENEYPIEESNMCTRHSSDENGPVSCVNDLAENAIQKIVTKQSTSNEAIVTGQQPIRNESGKTHKYQNDVGFCKFNPENENKSSSHKFGKFLCDEISVPRILSEMVTNSEVGIESGADHSKEDFLGHCNVNENQTENSLSCIEVRPLEYQCGILFIIHCV